MSNWAAHAVVLPGTGSDAHFASDAFAPALTAVGATVEAVDPDPTGVVASYVAALDAAADAHGPIIVGGISIGAAVAASWSARNPDRVLGILAVLPPWLGEPDDAPAAASARLTAHLLTAEGLEAVTEAMTASSPSWLATTLKRSWAAQWPALPSALIEAAAYVAPDVPMLRRLQTPTSVIGAVDDAVHPIDIARTWNREIPCSVLTEIRLDDIGADPGVLGRRAVEGLLGLTAA